MNNLLQKYAELSVKVGVNIQKGQKLVINSPIECMEFTRLIVKAAYDAGSSEVFVHWTDEICRKYGLQYGDFNEITRTPSWFVERQTEYAEAGAAFLSISASDPELLKDVDPNIIAEESKNGRLALKDVSARIMANKNSWCVISIPTKSWAKKVFPNDSEETAISKLWDAIFKIVRVDKENPIAAWKEHTDNLSKKIDLLNNKRISKLHYTNSLGTDFTIELPKDHLWSGGSEKVKNTDVDFVANMPTEEIFTAPHNMKADGTVYSALPLNYNGNLINDFKLTFKDGMVVDFDAKEGKETLKHLLDTDEGSKRLGEVALVPYDSPISNSKILFYNTLFDENASCHFALGKAYPECIKNGSDMTEEELSNAGLNTSLNHVDFMIGTSDLNIYATTESGEEFFVFKDGNWAL